jgi:hypothetical protein
MENSRREDRVIIQARAYVPHSLGTDRVASYPPRIRWITSKRLSAWLTGHDLFGYSERRNLHMKRTTDTLAILVRKLPEKKFCQIQEILSIHQERTLASISISTSVASPGPGTPIRRSLCHDNHGGRAGELHTTAILCLDI